MEHSSNEKSPWTRRRLLGQAALGLGAAVVTALPRRAHPAPADRAPFGVAGYLPEYRLSAVDPSVGRYVTDLIYFSIEPKPTGELDLRGLGPETLEKLHAIQEQSPVRVLVAAGGWGHSAGFAPMAADERARGAFAQALVRLCREHRFAGVDLDWEHPANAAEEESYAALMIALKDAFRPHGLLLTAALAGWQKVGAGGFEALDRVHLMAYDHRGPRHSTFEHAATDIEALVSRGAPQSKLFLGVPFYGRSMTERGRAMTYAEIVRAYQPAPEADEAGGFYFNGIRTIEQKTRLGIEKGLGGIMIWEVGQDTTDEASLLRTIHTTVAKQNNAG